VWSIGHDELPGIRLAWVTTLQVLPTGKCHRGQLPRRSGPSATIRGNAREESGVDIQRFQDVRQRIGSDACAGPTGKAIR
jgi:hypothetical protein